MPKFLGVGCVSEGLGRKGKENGGHSGQDPAVEHSEAEMMKVGVGCGGCIPRCSEAVGGSVGLTSAVVQCPPSPTALSLRQECETSVEDLAAIRPDKGFPSPQCL